jgi:hypothetical protein
MNPGLADWESIVCMHGPMACDTAWRLLGHVADKVEIEVNDKKMIEDLAPYVRPEEAGRWTIRGGIQPNRSSDRTHNRGHR